jgi:arylsulfatase A-like enzyme
MKTLLYFLSFSFLFLVPMPARGNESITILVVFDGLRPDYITPAVTPNLLELQKRGVTATMHHSVFPTLTRVNSASIAAGAYPSTHGIMGNSVYLPSIDSARVLDTGDAQNLFEITRHTHLFTSPTLGEKLRDAGKGLMIYSSGSTGQSFLLHHTASTSGAIINPNLFIPKGLLTDLEQRVGPVPGKDDMKARHHEWITRAFLDYGLPRKDMHVHVLWYSDPDGTAHATGVGSPETLASIRFVDKQLGIILDALSARGLDKEVNIIFTTDHGFITQGGKQRLAPFLVEKGLKASRESIDVVVAGGAIHVNAGGPNRVREIVEALIKEPWVGGIYTSPDPIDPMQGWMKGTLSTRSIHYDHPLRTPDILIDYQWDNTPNQYGYPGKNHSPGIAGHGGASTHEMHIRLIASGPAFYKGVTVDTPSCNVDIAPTILRLHGLSAPVEMNGRVLSELLVNGPAPGKPAVKETVATFLSGGQQYTRTLFSFLLDNSLYTSYTLTRVK